MISSKLKRLNELPSFFITSNNDDNNESEIVFERNDETTNNEDFYETLQNNDKTEPTTFTAFEDEDLEFDFDDI